jgi:hypothetical protein
VSASADLGHDVVYGYNVVANRGSRSVQLLTGALTGNVDTRDARVLDVRVYDYVQGGQGLLGADVWPSTSLPHNAGSRIAGYLLRPGKEVELLFIVRAERRGHWQWRGTVVTYRSAGRLYRREDTNGFVVCVPRVTICSAK